MRSGLAEVVERAEDAAAASTVEGRLLLLAGLRQAVDAAMVAALGQIAAAPGRVQMDGGIDGGQWLAARSELHPGEARALGGLADALPAMPATDQALSDGRIGVEKAHLLGTARDVNGFAEAEAGLVDAVIGVSLRRARRVIGRFIADNREVGPADPAANQVSLAPKRNGRWGLHGDLDAETATVIANELRRLADGHRDEGLNLGHRRALGLLDMTRRSITLGERGPGSRPRLCWSPMSASTATSWMPATKTAHPSPAGCSRTWPVTPPCGAWWSTGRPTRLSWAAPIASPLQANAGRQLSVTAAACTPTAISHPTTATSTTSAIG